MSRQPGGYIGFNRVPAASAINSAASGMWALREAEAMRRAGTWPSAFVNPASIAGLQFWLDAADPSTLFDATSGGSAVAADGAVARWEDKSGNARHATQATSGSRPTRKTAIRNDRDIVRFDGSNDFMSIASSSGLFNFLHGGSTGYTVFVVGRQSGTTNHMTLVNTGSGGDPSGDAAQRGFMLAVLADLRRYAVIRNGENDVATVVSTATVAQNSYFLLSASGTPNSGTAANRLASRLDGGSLLSNTSTGTSSTSNASRDFVIGRFLAYPGVGGSPEVDMYGNGDICEIAIYNSVLSDANRAIVDSYLMSKWAIP